MASQPDIYRSQLAVHRAKQPRHGIHLKRLDTKLGSLSKASPYSLSEDDFRKFERLAACGNTCLGLPGAVEGEYCYHITSVWKLQRNTETLELRVLRDSPPDQSFERLTRAYEDVEPNWLALKHFIGGRYTGRRKLTWWTTLDLSAGELQCSGHRMGLLNDDIDLDAIVLRCRSEYIRRNRMVFVPTAIDAFFSEIFQPTDDQNSPTCGVTIDLEHSPRLKDGVPEFAVPPIELDDAEIEFRPVNLRIESERRHKLYREDISDALLDHYKKLV
jgi:hypothetical protein